MSVWKWPVYFADNLILGSDQSSVGIATLWTPKEFFSKKISKQYYRVIGQLYSNDGINPLLRNVLANPTLRTIVVCGLDRIGSADALVKLIQNGVNDKWQVIGKKEAVVDKEIPRQAIELFRSNIMLVDLRGKLKAAEVQEVVQKCEQNIKPWARAQIFPEPQITTDRFPSGRTGFTYYGSTVADLWPKVLHGIMRFGTAKITHHGSRQKELLNVTSVITQEDPTDIKFAAYFAFTEEHFEQYKPQVLSAQQLPSLSYTYGSRLHDYHGIDQIASIVKKLQTAADSRQALATTWQVETDTNSAHPPCLITVQALVQDQKLFLTAYFRSNDMYRAWPENALALRMLQQKITQQLGLSMPMGFLTIISSSAHIYAENFASAQEIIEKYYPKLPCVQDPRGNYIISVKQQEFIEVIHQSPSGRKIDKFTGKTATQLMNKIASNQGISEISHALDLGAELQKAEIALQHGLEYTQDRPLKFKHPI